MEEKRDMSNLTSCPLPITDYPRILLAHGGGGRMMHQLISKVFLPAFDNPLLRQGHDSTCFSVGGQRIAMTTDSYVVRPLFFPGGDIGSLAVHGTVNDLAMAGARPHYLSASFILEEGLPTETLWKIVTSMRQAADCARIQIVTGDTKVVDRGKGDGVYINTTGLGIIEHSLHIGPEQVSPGDAVILSGDIGRHGIAIMNARENLGLQSELESDSAPVWEPVELLLENGVEVRCLRDLTRGGLASALIEIAESAQIRIEISERTLPVLESVRGACELLGLDPLFVANEGRFVAFVPQGQADHVVDLLQSHPLGHGACIIGSVAEGKDGLVTVESAIGVSRILDMFSGEQLPRIC